MATLTREGTSVETSSRALKGAWLARVRVGAVSIVRALEEGCPQRPAAISHARIGQGRIEGARRPSIDRLINGSVLINTDQTFLVGGCLLFLSFGTIGVGRRESEALLIYYCR
jgi:hypothetical protein